MMWLGVDPQLLAQLKWAIGGAQQFGEAVMLIIWGLGIAAITLGGWLARALIRARSSEARPCAALCAAHRRSVTARECT
jgi:hypothetical protein